jgi:uroporphyrinogen decarboxylase
VSAPFLPEIGVNLFNMGFDVTLNELKQLTGNKVTLLGNIPPRDVLANGSPEEVSAAAINLLNSLEDKSKVIMSCGGGMPPNVSSENIQSFLNAVKNYN